MNEIVTAVQFQNYVLVFTKDGTIYRIDPSPFDENDIKITTLHHLFPRT